MYFKRYFEINLKIFFKSVFYKKLESDFNFEKNLKRLF